MLKNISKINKRINEIKAAIIKLEDFRSGSMSEQYNVCGKANCKCKDKENPEKHGPYYQISCYKNKKHTTFFVKKENVQTIRNEMANYKILKSLLSKWIELSTELSNCRISE